MSMQSSMDVVYHVARVCKRKNAKLICSAEPAFELNEHSFPGAYVLVASLSGIDILLPGKGSLETKIGKLLGSHCENVIITNEYEGQCILINSEGRTRFTMKDFEFVSHTAAIDCFCGALAVALVGGKSLNEAVAYALTGASLAMSRKGSLPSLPIAEEIMDNINRVSDTVFEY